MHFLKFTHEKEPKKRKKSNRKGKRGNEKKIEMRKGK